MGAAIPQIHDVTVTAGYAGYQNGVDGVLDGLQSISGRSPDEVLEAVSGSPFAQRYNAMADVVIDSRLSGVMPPEHRSQIRIRLNRPLREELGSLARLDPNIVPPNELADRGRAAGARAVGRLEHELVSIEQHYEQHGGLQAPRMPMSVQDRAQVQRIEAFYGRPSIDHETAHLRQFLDTGAQAGRGGGAASGGAAAGSAAAAGAAAARPPAQAWSRSGGVGTSR
jgi:hypothetical protein